ncbi:MAG: ribonuclease domain-containing protein [Christensenellales bacterium]
MNKKKLNLLPLIILAALTIAFFLGGSDRGQEPLPSPGAAAQATVSPKATAQPKAKGMATLPAASQIPGDREAVANYIKAYGKLPDYYLTKAEARRLGWDGGSLEPYAPGKLIGGDRFLNLEGLLPEKKGRSYTECDIGTLRAASRGARRIVFSNDGLIYYTDDHYESFTRLLGDE